MTRGKEIYVSKCATCHKVDGSGDDYAPPLWGKSSFNSKAGMANPDIFAAFVHNNMPYEEPTVSIEEALDVTAYVLSQPRD